MTTLELVLQCIGVALGYFSSLVRDKNKVILYACFSNLVSILIFALNDRLDGALSVIIIWLRCILFLFRDKYKTNIVVWICAIAHIIVGVISYTDVFSIITISVPVIICFTYWYGSILSIKYISNILSIFWIIYYIYLGLYITAINTVISIVLTSISILEIHKEQSKKE